MAADRRDLAARKAAATKADTVRGLIFNGAFDLVREHAGDAAALACDPAGKGKRTDFLSYPVTEYLDMAWNVADELEGRLGGVDAVFHGMGYRATANVFGSMVGHTLLAFGRSPRSLFAQAPSGYRATVSYGQRFVTWLGQTRCRIEFVHDFLVVPFHCGVFRAGLDAVQARDGHAEGQQAGFLHTVYDISWT
jgi:uncharacterized protein (TIGR02265 family)